MEENDKLPIVMECPANYILKEIDGQEIARGVSNLQLDREKLAVFPISGEPLLIYYRDIMEISDATYRIEVKLISKEVLTIYNLGYKYEDFFRNLSNLNNEVILKDLLMNENILKSGVEADFSYVDINNVEKTQGKCELRIYETGLVIISGMGEFIRIPHCDVRQINVENYKLVVTTEYQDSYTFSKMGKDLDICFKMLNNSIISLSTKTQLSLKELFPAYDSSVIRKVARLMKDGRAARSIDIQAISPSLWGDFEKKLEILEIKEEYEYLKSMAQAQRIRIGIKRGLMGDLTGEYIWFLAPIFNTDHDQPGNAVAMEATAVDGGGKATYFFKMTDQNTYLNLKNQDELQTEADKSLDKLNRLLVAVNFRREPIYLTDEQLNSTTYVGYLRAIKKIPDLRELRSCFIGRVAHHSLEQWKEDTMHLLAANMNAG